MTREELLSPLTYGESFGPEVFDGWEAVPGFIDGVHVCTAVLKGSEIHFGIVPQHRKKVIRQHNTKEFLRPLFERTGFLTTRVFKHLRADCRFVERLGFVPSWEDQYFRYYFLWQLPFSRSVK